MTRQTQAFLCAGGTVLAWSTVSTAFKIALADLSPTQLIAVGMGTAALFLLLMMPFSRSGGFRCLTGRQRLNSLLLGAMLYVYYTVLFIGYEHLPAQIAQPINYTWAIMFALLASWILRQRITLLEFFWMIVAYSGVLVITLGAGGTLGPLSPLGLACIIASTALYALYWIANTRCGTATLPALALCFAMACLLAVLTLLLRGEPLALPLGPLLSGVYVGLFELAIPFLLWGRALALTSDVSRISTLPFLVPFLALFWISLVLHEPLAWPTFAGLSIIILGTYMQQKMSRKNAARKS